MEVREPLVANGKKHFAITFKWKKQRSRKVNIMREKYSQYQEQNLHIILFQEIYSAS
ncbi:MAG: hypothetical protein JWR18_1884 [Segetibacter sp.]|nr:hypothetical protein [Segetibacter sp.]